MIDANNTELTITLDVIVSLSKKNTSKKTERGLAPVNAVMQFQDVHYWH